MQKGRETLRALGKRNREGREMKPCPKCGCYEWRHRSWRTGKHVCPPRFLVCLPEYHGDGVDDGQYVHAPDPESAAEKWAEKYDSEGDYPVLDGGPITVRVADSDGTVTHWKITAEASVNYYTEDADGGAK